MELGYYCLRALFAMFMSLLYYAMSRLVLYFAKLTWLTDRAGRSHSYFSL